MNYVVQTIDHFVFLVCMRTLGYLGFELYKIVELDRYIIVVVERLKFAIDQNLVHSLHVRVLWVQIDSITDDRDVTLGRLVDLRFGLDLNVSDGLHSMQTLGRHESLTDGNDGLRSKNDLR